MSRLRGPGGIAVGLVLVVLSVTPVAAESTLWTLTATPLTAVVGTPSAFSLRATNEDPLATLVPTSRIGCVRIDVPSNFAVTSVQIAGSTPGNVWTTGVAGNRIHAQAVTEPDRLRTLEWVAITVRATPNATGSLAWASRAFERTDCGGSGALLGVSPIVVVTGARATPTPVQTPVPTPVPTPVLTPVPTPVPTLLPTLAPTPTLPPLESVRPSLPPSGTPRPTPTDRPTVSDEPRATPDPTAATSGIPRASDGSDALAAPSSSGPAASDDGPAGSAAGGPPVLPLAREGGPAVLVEPAELQLGGTGIGLAGVGVWVVPGAAIAGPGVVILIWIALQALGAFAWMPAVRRLRDDGERTSA